MRGTMNLKTVLAVVVTLHLTTLCSGQEVIHVQDDFEDGILTVNPAWTLEGSGEWTTVVDPTDLSNLVARAFTSPSSGSYLRLDLPANVPWENAAIQVDFLLTDSDEFGVYVDLRNSGYSGALAGARPNKSIYMGSEFVAVNIPTEEGTYTSSHMPLWPIPDMVWHQLKLRYDENKRQFVITVTHRSSGVVVGDLAFTPPSDIETIPAINHIDVGVGSAALGVPIYIDNVLFRTSPPLEGDLDDDCEVDLADLAILLANYGMTCQ